MITQADLHELFYYDKDTGIFTRKINVGKRAKAGDIITNTNNNGYIVIVIDRQKYQGHRMAWLYVYGCLPKYLDHKNGIRHDNRIENLRECTIAENNSNRSTTAIGDSGHKGILWSYKYNSYVARLAVNKQRFQKTFTISKFPSKEEALQAAVNWLAELRTEHHKEFACYG